MFEHARADVDAQAVLREGSRIGHIAQVRASFGPALKKGHQVSSGVSCPVPNHRLRRFDVEAELPEAERAARERLSLPLHPLLSKGDLKRIVEALEGTETCITVAVGAAA